ncbi:MAG: hypothetical protein IJ083_14140 [Clostridia bacterium]|nr:hypothetical protein [Clostridia bacterium]
MHLRQTGKQFCTYAVPQMIGLLFNSVYILVDGIFIGRFLGRNSLAAAGIAVPLTELLIAVAMAVASGSGERISFHLARRETGEANRLFHTAVLLMGLISLMVLTVTECFSEKLCLALGATAEILPDAQVYLRTVMAGAPFQLFSFLLGAMARNDRAPGLAMAGMTVGAACNMFLDWLFMGPMHMGIFGAALATALGPVITCSILLGHFFMGRGELSFQGPWSGTEDTSLLKSGLSILRSGLSILKSGLSAFVLEFTIGLITFLMNRSIVHCGYGEVGLAAYLLIGYLLLIYLTLYLGMAEGLQPLFSRCRGEGDTEGQRDLLRFSAAAFSLIGLICYLLVLFFSDRFMQIFAPEDPELVLFAAARCPLYFSGFVFAGWGILCISFWQATGETRYALPSSLLRALVFPAFLLLVLPLIFGREAIWAAHSAAEALSALFCAFLYLHVRHRS